MYDEVSKAVVAVKAVKIVVKIRKRRIDFSATLLAPYILQFLNIFYSHICMSIRNAESKSNYTKKTPNVYRQWRSHFSNLKFFFLLNYS